MKLYLVKYQNDNGKTVYWPESLNKACAGALTALFEQRGQRAEVIPLKVSAKALISFCSTEQPSVSSLANPPMVDGHLSLRVEATQT